MNEDELRQLLGRAATPGRDDEVRVQSALYEGHRRHRTRRRRHVAVGAGGLAALTAAGVLALVPGPHRAAPLLALECGPGVGSSSPVSDTSSSLGVTLSVVNPTHQLLSVQGGGTDVFAVPGTSQVTLPLSSGRVRVTCGGGSATLLVVQPASSAGCSSAVTGLEASVQTGEPAALTKARLGVLPADALVQSLPSPGPLQRVRVSVGGAVVAEAIWHQMPDPSSWQLESLSRCRSA